VPSCQTPKRKSRRPDKAEAAMNDGQITLVAQHKMRRALAAAGIT
jgi:hypothetical protein